VVSGLLHFFAQRSVTGKKVVVLGGGIGGLSAAHELAERRFSVEIFDLRDIPGGKSRTLPARPLIRPPGEHRVAPACDICSVVIWTKNGCTVSNIRPATIHENACGAHHQTRDLIASARSSIFERFKRSAMTTARSVLR
jgi:hypothetical protein